MVRFFENNLKTFLILTTLALLALGSTISASPLFFPIPDRDSGVFLYTAEKILDGGLPYRNVWDHKPPVIYYLNVLGLLVGNGSTWGIWIFELLSIFTSLLIGFRILSNAFDNKSSWLSLYIICVQLLFLIEDGNYTEVFALPLQFILISLYLSISLNSSKRFKWLIYGVLGGILFLLRQNLIGIWIAGILALLLSSSNISPKNSLRNLFTLGIGLFIVVLIVVFYFGYHGILYEFWDASFIYNIFYSGTTPGVIPRIHALLSGIRVTWQTGFLLFGLIGYTLCIKFLVKNNIRPNNYLGILLTLVVIDLPIEIALFCISGRYPPHYIITWIPTFTVLIAFFAQSLLSRINKYFYVNNFQKKVILLFIVFFIFLIPPSVTMLRNLPPSFHMIAYYSQHKPVVDYILTNTNEDDYVLFWGAETSINFYTERKSPTRFVYQYPLVTKGYQTPMMVEEFFNEIVQNDPKVIIDAWKGTDKMPPIDQITRDNWVSPWSETYGMLPEMEKVTDYITENYRISGYLGPQEWVVYTRK